MTRTRTEIMPSRMDRGSHEVTEASNVRAVLTAYTGILASVVGVALVLGMPGHWPALAEHCCWRVYRQARLLCAGSTLA